MFGAWGRALPKSNGLLQLRGLDWITDGGLQNWPEITVYHPSGSDYGQYNYTNFEKLLLKRKKGNDKKREKNPKKREKIQK